MFLKKKSASSKNKSNPIIINGTVHIWGHDIHFDKLKDSIARISIDGHSAKHFDVGDYIIFTSSNKSSFGVRYKIIDIEWMEDPQDMFFATGLFANVRSEQSYDSEMLRAKELWWPCKDPISTEQMLELLAENKMLHADDVKV